MALAYDATFTRTALGTCLRAMVWQRLDAAFEGCARILDIGCGTGEDAVHLARRGLQVLATDASSSMLAVARQKAERAGCAERIQFRAVPAEALGTALAGECFDGVCSNFGAINCMTRLDRVVAEIAPLLRPGAHLVWVVMGRHVPWEWVWFLCRGDWHRAFRRSRRDGTVWKGQRILYPTPAELARTLGPQFVPVTRSPLGFVLPPSYAAGWLERSPRRMAFLAKLERAAQHSTALAGLADHYVMEARRAPVPADA